MPFPAVHNGATAVTVSNDDTMATRNVDGSCVHDKSRLVNWEQLCNAVPTSAPMAGPRSLSERAALAGQRSDVARRHTNTATHLADPTPSILSKCELDLAVMTPLQLPIDCLMMGVAHAVLAVLVRQHIVVLCCCCLAVSLSLSRSGATYKSIAAPVDADSSRWQLPEA